jgi:hypothetical protein
MFGLNSIRPILRRKQHEMDIQDLEGLLRIQFKFKDITLFSSFYTRIDQVFLMWGSTTALIFCTAQFFPFSWAYQAYLWSILTLLSSWGTFRLAWYWATVEQLRWIIYVWVGLMLGGIALTNWSIFGGWWIILPYLGQLWLGLSAIGYLTMAWGMRSRAFLLIGLLHLGGMCTLSHVPPWQFLVTGIITAGSLLLLAEVQWDMQSISDFHYLTEEQKKFNQQQLCRRQQAG